MASLQVDHVSKAIAGTPILRDVSFEVTDGVFYALLGPSGSGKTTILRTIAGFSHPDEGRVLVAGNDVTGVPPHRRNLGIVFQNYALFPHLSVFANVEFGLRMRSMERGKSREAVHEALELVGIEHLAERRPAQLSGGEQQRVALARALVIRPSLLLLDEPLSALDRKIRQELQVELKRVQNQTQVTTIMVTHDQEEVLYLADELLVLESGRIRQVGAPADVYHDPQDVFVASFMGASNIWEATLAADGGRAVARVGELLLPVSTPLVAAGDGTGVAGLRVVVSVRPESIALGLPEAPEADSQSVRIPAVVEEIEFVGPIARVRLRVGGLGAVSLQLARTVVGWGEGTHLLASIDPADIKCYVETGEEGR